MEIKSNFFVGIIEIEAWRDEPFVLRVLVSHSMDGTAVWFGVRDRRVDIPRFIRICLL